MRLAIATVAVACLIALQAQAQRDSHMSTTNPRTAEEVERVFEAIDRDGDDRISKREGERSELIGDRFDGVDADQDGYLSRAEFRARPRKERFE